MDLKKIVLTLALSVGACATAQQQVGTKSGITDVYCGPVKWHYICIAQYPSMEVSYARRTRADYSSCSVLITYKEDGNSEFLKDDDCDMHVDAYLKTDVFGYQEFMNREQDEKRFVEELDHLYNKLMSEVLEAAKNGIQDNSSR